MPSLAGKTADRRRKSIPIMSETEITETLKATPLATILASSRTVPELAAYRGVLTPRRLDAPEAETAALLEGAAVHDLGWMRHVGVRGEDRFRWLSGMVTNTVNDLLPNTGAWNLVLNAQGRIQGDLTVWREGEELSPRRRKTSPAASKDSDPEAGTPFAGETGLDLELAADQYDKLMAHLNQFIIMDDVELVPQASDPLGDAGAETAIGLSGPLADEVLARMGLPVVSLPMTGTSVERGGMSLRILRGYGVLVPHYELWLPSAELKLFWSGLRTAGATSVGCETLEAFRVAEGIPLYGVDIAERDLPQETAQMRALHFAKGCYLGQEIVERIHSRGSVHRHLRPLELTGPVPATVTDLAKEDGSVAGQITSAAKLPLAEQSRVFALAMVKADAEAREQSFTYQVGSETGTARILTAPPTFMPKRKL